MGGLIYQMAKPAFLNIVKGIVTTTATGLAINPVNLVIVGLIGGAAVLGQMRKK